MKKYAELKEEIKSLEGHYTWGSETDLLFAKQKAYFKIKRHALDVFGVQFGAVETSDRGVALVQLVYQDTGKEEAGEILEPTGFNLKVNFVEDGFIYGCSKVVAAHITDEVAQTYLKNNAEIIKNMPSIGEKLRQQ